MSLKGSAISIHSHQSYEREPPHTSVAPAPSYSSRAEAEPAGQPRTHKLPLAQFPLQDKSDRLARLQRECELRVGLRCTLVLEHPFPVDPATNLRLDRCGCLQGRPLHCHRHQIVLKHLIFDAHLLLVGFHHSHLGLLADGKLHFHRAATDRRAESDEGLLELDAPGAASTLVEHALIEERDLHLEQRRRADRALLAIPRRLRLLDEIVCTLQLRVAKLGRRSPHSRDRTVQLATCNPRTLDTTE
mmetsp:Transcript_4120/g.10689  ORF Transcript_4120/g.10689 Transcript_4120/m.10689 type:complete len:245 (+) Transcript_4120:570-1304(+)